MGKKAIRYRGITLILYFLLCVIGKAGAQTINNAPSFTIKDYKILPDAGYNFDRVLKDTSLKFTTDSVLNTAVSNSYWVKATVYNPYPNDEDYIVAVSAPLNYTFYCATEKGKWVSRPLGINASNRQRRLGVTPIVLYAQAANSFYLKVDLSDVSSGGKAINLQIKLEKTVWFNSHEQVSNISFLICCIALISFSCYNLYIYFHLKDVVYLHYVYTQLGALLYFTGTERYFNVLFPLRIYNQRATSNGFIDAFDINNFFIHVGVALIFWGLARFTRSYLRTQELLPVYDKVLKILANTYVIVELVPTLLTITGIYFVELIVIDNIFVLAIIITCLITGFVAYRRKVSAASHFLAAVFIPAVFTASTSAYILILDSNSTVLPTIAILSQILTFAVALVARVKLINEDLRDKAIEAIRLETTNTIIANERLLMEQENAIITLSMALEKEHSMLLQTTLEANQRELMGKSVYILQKNQLLADLKTQVKDISALYPHSEHGALKTIQSSLNDGEYLDDEWDKFKLHFEQVHPSFFKDLQASHPKLTKYELRLYAYFHINMSTKEIATLLNIAPASVRQAKARLSKKMKV
jgi:DNA-binding NarL/FixJ family response regulator